MKTTSFSLSVAILATTLLTPQMAEASATPRLNSSSLDRSRPVHRSVERATRNYRAEMATLRRAFVRQMQSIEVVKDAIAPEEMRTEAPEFVIDEQGHTPYYRALTRRHVRHLYWVNEFRGVRKAQQGEGPIVIPEMPSDEDEDQSEEVQEEDAAEEVIEQ